MRSILSGLPYPKNILSILLSRMRVDQEYYQLNYYRASFIKAILNRNYQKELTMSLDHRRSTIPYLLGLMQPSENERLGEAYLSILSSARNHSFASNVDE